MKNEAVQEEKENISAWEVAEASKKDDEVLVSLFSRVFGQAMSHEQWRWKYNGTKHWGMVVRKNREVLAFYGGMQRPIRLFGEEAKAVQIGDVMVDPANRRTY